MVRASGELFGLKVGFEYSTYIYAGFFCVVCCWTMEFDSERHRASILFASYIRGSNESTKILRRNLVRYLVLCQALVLRDISMQVRKRFPTMDTLAASVLLSIFKEISKFRHGLAALLKYDWVPVPLVYPQVIFLAVRFYFIICLFGRQFIVTGNNPSGIDLWLPITTMIQFIVYMGWMKVAEALLNPLGEDDDDLECNYIIDKNLMARLRFEAMVYSRLLIEPIYVTVFHMSFNKEKML
ncbi:Bestrophin [Dictyocaulus viviparus]|uniref:Bestrophin homolog n=1 Tax=Dictyocaulus viviparus TaxID=29172 RepID=A0A0D8Y7A3_DICVI|nr:Bestrophin [Dictyocaulus viviparus]